MSKLLVVGTGKCGSRFTSEFLTELGVKVGHEAVFNVDGFHGYGDADGDSSFAIPAYEENISWGRDCMLHIVRNPLDVVRSQMGNDFWLLKEGENPWNDWWRIHLSEILYLDPGLDRAVGMVYLWNKICEGYNSNMSYTRQSVDRPLSKFTIEMLSGFVEAKWSEANWDWLSKMPSNSVGRDASITWSQIIRETHFGTHLLKMARGYGYV